MGKRSITLHYLLWTWGFFLLVLSGVFLFATHQAERAVTSEAEDRAATALDLAGYLLSQHAPFGDAAALATWADEIGPHLGFRLTYIVSGKVLADSAVHAGGVAEMEDHATRPEVLAALRGGFGQDVRTSHTLGRDMLYVARTFSGAQGIAPGILRLALPVSSLRGELARFRRTLLLALALVFVAGGVAAYGLARGMSRTLQEISGVVASIGQGHYDRRIHIVPARDFAPLAGAINVLAERIGSHVREIEERRQRQEAIFDSMAEGVAILDTGGHITAGNRALEEMFPKVADLAGRTPIEVGMPLCVERALDAFEPADGPTQRIGRFELANGRVVEVIVACVAGEAIEGARVVTFHDVTEAATMDRIFRDFVIDASHNLRTPLTKVRGFAETARDLLPEVPTPETPEADAAKALTLVIRAADDMKTMIDDLLAMARDRFAAARAAVPGADALAALRQALATNDPLLRAKGVVARIVAAPEGPLSVTVGYENLVRAFSALITQTPGAVSLGVTASLVEEAVEIRFEGPALLDIQLPNKDVAEGGGTVFLDGAARVVRLPLAAG